MYDQIDKLFNKILQNENSEEYLNYIGKKYQAVINTTKYIYYQKFLQDHVLNIFDIESDEYDFDFPSNIKEIINDIKIISCDVKEDGYIAKINVDQFDIIIYHKYVGYYQYIDVEILCDELKLCFNKDNKRIHLNMENVDDFFDVFDMCNKNILNKMRQKTKFNKSEFKGFCILLFDIASIFNVVYDMQE